MKDNRLEENSALRLATTILANNSENWKESIKTTVRLAYISGKIIGKRELSKKFLAKVKQNARPL
jgi:hypothetical protein